MSVDENLKLFVYIFTYFKMSSRGFLFYDDSFEHFENAQEFNIYFTETLSQNAQELKAFFLCKDDL